MIAPRIGYERLLWTTGCLALSLAPHIGGIPVWVLGTCAAAAAIRLGLAARGRDAPPQVLRILIALLAIALLFVAISYLQRHQGRHVAARAHGRD